MLSTVNNKLEAPDKIRCSIPSTSILLYLGFLVKRARETYQETSQGACNL